MYRMRSFVVRGDSAPPLASTGKGENLRQGEGKGFSLYNVGARSGIISHLGTWDYFGRSRAAIDAIDAVYIYIIYTYRAGNARGIFI